MGCCMFTPLTITGSGSAGCFEDRRHDVDHVVKLVSDAAFVLDVRAGQEP